MNKKSPSMLSFIEDTPKQIHYNIENLHVLTEQIINFYLQKDYQTIWIIASGSSANGSQCAKPFLTKYLHL